MNQKALIFFKPMVVIKVFNLYQMVKLLPITHKQLKLERIVMDTKKLKLKQAS